MNLRDLSYLVAVARFANFTHAASYCSVSQSTLSTQIKKLEDYLGAAIFVREKNQVSITAFGETILPFANRVLADAQQIRLLAKAAHAPQQGKFSLGAFPSIGSYVLPEFLFRIKQHSPNLKVVPVEEKTRSLIDLLADMKLDAAMLAMPVEHPELMFRTLFEDPFTLAVSSSHPLAAQHEVDLHMIEKENLLLLDEGHCLRDQILNLCDPSRFIEHDFRAASLETLRFMVKKGVGVTLMPATAVPAPSISTPPDDNGIRYIKIREQPSRTIALAWHKNHPQQAMLEELSILLADRPIY